MQKLSKQKAELVNAQTLFDLDVKPYPALQLTLSELDQLERIYGLYQKFREFQETMSSTGWGELDIAGIPVTHSLTHSLALKGVNSLTH